MSIIKTNPASTKSAVLLASLTALSLLPFITKAFHIDDTLFLACAKQIQTNPADFYGFLINWYGWEQPMFLVNQNPPLAAYFIAGVTWLFGWTEAAIHAAFFVPTILLSVGIYFLAGRFCSRPLLAGLTGLFTPAFLVSSTNIMTDTLMLTFYIWAVVFWMEGIAKNNHWRLFIACIFISLSALTKYFGMSLIPLLLAYTLLKKRKSGYWLLHFLIPVAVLIGYQLLSFSLYDTLLISNAAEYALTVGALGDSALLLSKTMKGLSYTGGCFIGVFFFAPLLWSRRNLFRGTVVFLLYIIILLISESFRAVLLPGLPNISLGLIFQYALFSFTGMLILLLATHDLWTAKTIDSLFLNLWIFGVFFFATYINWTINARVLLPMVPVVGILVARRLRDSHTDGYFPKIFHYAWPLIPSAVLALSAAWADTTLANCQRSAARQISHAYSGTGTLWFQGHWGFQYYMEKMGAKPMDYRQSDIPTGDILILPVNNTNLRRLPRNWFHFVEERLQRPSKWMGTMSPKHGAGFYWGGYGPLPFAVGQMEPEKYLVFLVGNYKNPNEAVADLKKLVKPSLMKAPPL